MVSRSGYEVDDSGSSVSWGLYEFDVVVFVEWALDFEEGLVVLRVGDALAREDVERVLKLWELAVADQLQVVVFVVVGEWLGGVGWASGGLHFHWLGVVVGDIGFATSQFIVHLHHYSLLSLQAFDYVAVDWALGDHADHWVLEWESGHCLVDLVHDWLEVLEFECEGGEVVGGVLGLA